MNRKQAIAIMAAAMLTLTACGAKKDTATDVVNNTTSTPYASASETTVAETEKISNPNLINIKDFDTAAQTYVLTLIDDDIKNTFANRLKQSNTKYEHETVSNWVLNLKLYARELGLEDDYFCKASSLQLCKSTEKNKNTDLTGTAYYYLRVNPEVFLSGLAESKSMTVDELCDDYFTMSRTELLEHWGAPLFQYHYMTASLGIVDDEPRTIRCNYLGYTEFPYLSSTFSLELSTTNDGASYEIYAEYDDDDYDGHCGVSYLMPIDLHVGDFGGYLGGKYIEDTALADYEGYHNTIFVDGECAPDWKKESEFFLSQLEKDGVTERTYFTYYIEPPMNARFVPEEMLEIPEDWTSLVNK